MQKIQGKLTPSQPSKLMPIVVQVATGWTVHLAGADGKNILNLAVFPHKFLAEEALENFLKRERLKGNYESGNF